jgi:hypothetical protein
VDRLARSISGVEQRNVEVCNNLNGIVYCRSWR